MEGQRSADVKIGAELSRPSLPKPQMALLEPEHGGSQRSQSPISPFSSPQTEIDHWRNICSKINSALDRNVVYTPESENLRVVNRGMGTAKEEMARLKVGSPRFLKRRSKVRLYNIKVRLNSQMASHLDPFPKHHK